MSLPACFTQIPELNTILEGADHVDIKSAVGSLSLRGFIAGTFTYQPRWVTFLYGIRWGFVRLLGLTQEGISPYHRTSQPDDVPLQPGDTFQFLTVKRAEPDRYWVGGFDDKHLLGHVVVAAEPLDDQRRRFYLMTVVHYHNWAGPVYFNAIRPFHHLIVHLAVKAAVRPPA